MRLHLIRLICVLCLLTILSSSLFALEKDSRPERCGQDIFGKVELRALNLTDTLAETFQDGRIQPQAVSKFLAHYPGDFVEHNGQRFHFYFQPSTHPGVQDTVSYIGGLGNNIPRELSHDLRRSNKLAHAHELILEAPGQGATFADELIRAGGQSPLIIPFETVEERILAALPQIRNAILKKHNIDIFARPMTAEGLSWGGWATLRLLANPNFNRYFDIGVFHDPGLLDLGDWLHPQLHQGVRMLNAWNDLTLRAARFSMPVLNLMVNDANRMNRRVNDIRDPTRAYMIDRFHTFQEGPNFDPYLLEGAASMFMGIREQNVLRDLSRIPSRIPLHFFIAGEGDVMPPSLFIALIKASHVREPHATGHRLSMILAEGVEHDMVSSQREDLQKLVVQYQHETQNQGFWRLTRRGRLERVTEETMITLLSQKQARWEELNSILINNPSFYVSAADQLKPSTGFARQVDLLADHHMGAYRLLVRLSRERNGYQILDRLSDQRLFGSRLWQLYRQEARSNFERLVELLDPVPAR